MAVVCAGPKAILDVPATLEYLETRGVPVVAVGQTELPGFYARSSGHPGPGRRRRTSRRPPRSSRTHLGLGLGERRSSCACRCPADAALPDDVARDAVERAIAEAEASADRRAGPHAVAARPRSRS